MTPERFARLKAALERRQTDLVVLAEDVHKPHNVSALLRTCDAVGIPELHAVSPGGDVERHHMVSGGSRKWVRTVIHRDIRSAISTLRGQGLKVIAAHVTGDAINYLDWDYTRATALMIGSELAGVSDAAAAEADARIMVPMRGLVESLNVSVAAAIILYEAARQREAAGLYERSRLAPGDFRDVLFEWCYPAVARVCRVQGLPYPALDADGFIEPGTLAQSVRLSRERKARRTSGAAS